MVVVWVLVIWICLSFFLVVCRCFIRLVIWVGIFLDGIFSDEVNLVINVCFLVR